MAEVIVVRAKILAYMVSKSPVDGTVHSSDFRSGPISASNFDIALEIRALVADGLLSMDESAVEITHDGWKWIQDNRDAVEEHVPKQDPDIPF